MLQQETYLCEGKHEVNCPSDAFENKMKAELEEAKTEGYYKKAGLALATSLAVLITMFLISLGILLTGLIAFTSSNTANALNNGVAKLPVLGYNTWYAYQCDISEELILQMAQLMKSLGLQAVGYEFVNIDDCWAEKNRTAAGDIIEDQVRFKGGMKLLNQQIHALGFKTGIYSDSGWFTCAGYPGSYSNELRDAQTFADMGFDFLKYDNCAIPYDSITRQGEVGRYQLMSDALAQVGQSTGRNFVFSLCEWGWTQVWVWGAQLGHSWRTTGDLSTQWETLTAVINFNSFLTQATNFYGRNDMDILQLGNGGLTFEEAKSHFTAWALMKSPLLVRQSLSHQSLIPSQNQLR
ncbi:glycoside hydrolase family 27 protein [Hypholoma sublateritium FD-334 SS-4]|uniref:Alpha-galactosidase n=1 Tax=Hypholoma sublateritium (strain FD-334 SS-4) TaxID=945553 RepID=A0A0D2NUR6_HYPSF|nr:glycoside hydrolase family 27 protein [Hypholoma sublateritium FD-334 SS-4]